MTQSINLTIIVLLAILTLTACSTAKLEARIVADPQCKPIINSKTGSLMPCPGTEKGFYASLGLISNKVDIIPNGSSGSAITSSTPKVSTKPVELTPTMTQPPPECKPQLHKKTGITLPCPSD